MSNPLFSLITGNSDGDPIISWTPSSTPYSIGLFCWNGLSEVTNITINDATGYAGYDFESFNDLTGFYCPNLVALDPENRYGGFITVVSCPELKETLFPELITTQFCSIRTNNSLELCDFSKLEQAFAINISNNATLSQLHLEQLTINSDSLQIYNNDSLTGINLPQLVTCNGTLNITDSASLVEVSMPQLVNAFYVNICNLPLMTSCALSQLAVLDYAFQFLSNTSITGLNLLELQSVNNEFIVASCDNLTTLLTPEITRIGGNVFIHENVSLANVSFPQVTGANSVAVYSNLSITGINFASLLYTNGIDINQNAALTTVNLSQLDRVNGICNITDNVNLNQLSFPELTFISGDLIIVNNTTLLSSSFPNLSGIGGEVFIRNNISLPTVSMPELRYVYDDVRIFDNNNMTGLSLPQLTFISGEFNIENNNTLTTLQIPSFIFNVDTILRAGTCALNQETVDHILARAVATAEFVAGQIYLDGGTSSSPSSTGLTYKNILTGRGVEVYTN